MTVREYAYAVEAGTSREKVGFLLWSRFREVAASLQDRNKGKLIELSIYDHVFEGNPGGAPLATLVWKDWRGGPVAEFPGFAATSVPPAPASETSLAEAPASSGAPPQEPQKPQEPQEPEDGRGAPPEPGPESAPISSDAAPFELVAPNAAHSPAAATPAAELDLPLDTGALEAMLEAGPQPSQRSPSRRAFDISGEHPIARVSSPPASAAPVSARKAGEDLLDDLFDVMHELRFAGDLIAGAEFVAEVLGRVLPSELTLVHVFDIDAREFVTVRATGTGSERALLQRASERDALLFETMRARRAVSAAAPSDARLRCERFVRCGVEARSVACAGVQWQGRYLGALELVNPLDGGGFERGDLNALDYVSEQFAEFAANHSIVLDQESVLRPRFR